MTILAASNWRTNAHLIEDVVALGYIRPDDEVCDLTYGRGGWWKRYRPQHLLACTWKPLGFPDLDPVVLGTEEVGIHDFAWVPYLPTGQFDVVAFDPPYISPGGRRTSTVTEFNDRYGLVECESTPQSLAEHNGLGLREAARICKPGGYILAKCMNYISSGKMVPAAHWMFEMGDHLGLEVCEEFHHVGHERMQPPGRRQVHARSNVSILYVFRKPRRTK